MSISAGADTVGFSISNMLNNLARYPEIQQKCYQALSDVSFRCDSMNDCPYFLAALWERSGFEKYGTITLKSSRDLIFSVYKIPKKIFRGWAYCEYSPHSTFKTPVEVRSWYSDGNFIMLRILEKLPILYKHLQVSHTLRNTRNWDKWHSFQKGWPTRC